MVAVATSSLPRSFPLPRTRLIGREEERATARAYLLDEAVPLLTLTGPSGVGKTRLSLAIVSDVAAHFADGLVWIDLAPLTVSGLLPVTIAAALDLTLVESRSAIDELVHHLRPRQTLLVVDNCEHLLDAAADLVSALLTGFDWPMYGQVDQPRRSRCEPGRHELPLIDPGRVPGDLLGCGGAVHVLLLVTYRRCSCPAWCRAWTQSDVWARTDTLLDLQQYIISDSGDRICQVWSGFCTVVPAQ